MRAWLAIGTIGLLAACNDPPEPPANQVHEAIDAAANAAESAETIAENATAAPITDTWVGRWRGPEGLNLEIARDPVKGEGRYKLSMRYTLDDQGSFEGTATPEGIAFTRPDGPQLLRATDGAATGLKYLAEKRDCLTVKQGEGYCRD